ncbi:flagellar FliJ family protein [Shewanella corallii]|uniref:Flagellar FliJ protein n=2 Tax=Shewanella TaxID=22 RepID=A0ABT0N9A2_9GAMM|nr:MULTISPECIES: flagellar FliJ family protein [Shewanella]MCL1038739.1 flagellar FliJ family protein [Shewanella submarina]MCL2915054.1 flagellar FliJ family protein [Shewanella corallii]
MNAIQRLSEREEDKLRQLGERRRELGNKVSQLQHQLDTLRQLSLEYQGGDHANALLWQNQQQMCNQLQPMDKALERQLALTILEQQRLEKLWQAQLGRWQGLNWLVEQKKQALQQLQARQEQKVTDDLAGHSRFRQ